MFPYVFPGAVLAYILFLENVSGVARLTPGENSINATGLILGNVKNGRSFFPLVMVNVPPQPCSATNGNTNEGVCMSKKRCGSSTRGTSIGSCQDGFGSCCRFTNQCTTNSASVTVVETVENLIRGTSAGACEYVFPRQPGICQVRLDFVSLPLADATAIGDDAGNCQADSLSVTGAANIEGILRVCGILTGQHMILSYGANTDEFSVTINAAAYDVRATQIACTSPNKAPDDCLQLYTDATDVVRSFGFPIQLNNQRYKVCVRPASGGNTLTWNTCNAMDAGAQMNLFRVSFQTMPTLGVDCTTDWIVLNEQRICGTGFDELSLMYAGGFKRLHVHFDENETGNDVFFLDNPLAQPILAVTCQAVTILPPTFLILPPGGQPVFCDLPVGGDRCRCTFSNGQDMFAQTLQIDLQIAAVANQGFRCPPIQGYTTAAQLPMPCVPANGNICCQYISNIRITETANTGFCLRYRAM